MTTLLNGVLGGLLIGLLAGFVMRIFDRDSLGILERVIGANPAMSRWLKLAIQGLYGSIAGGLLLVLELSVLGLLAVPPSLSEALGVAVAWSAVLFILQIIAGRADRSLLPGSSVRALFVYHLVFGMGLGVWIRVTWIT
jgi:hypothetical protein